jgi:hypothetical protein
VQAKSAGEGNFGHGISAPFCPKGSFLSGAGFAFPIAGTVENGQNLQVIFSDSIDEQIGCSGNRKLPRACPDAVAAHHRKCPEAIHAMFDPLNLPFGRPGIIDADKFASLGKLANGGASP